ncbi:MAG: TAT-variant-translocated molybdopterin oxidoreductase, partial [Pyrinomonadaceae bacterium]
MPSKDSKTNFALLRDRILEKSGKDYWRSVEEFVDAPEFEEFVSREYPQHAEEWEDGLSRRNFIKIMGASLALAGLSGCVIQPPEKIVPYVRQPEEIIPGKPLYFATAMTLGGVATGLLAKSNEGRPTKLEGNPEHPGSLGATDALAQASLLGMYDPDRSQQDTYLGNPTTWQNFMKAIRAATDENRGNGGAGIRFLTETVTSPTLIAQFKQILAELPNARWYQYEPVNKDNAMAGAKMAFGAPAQAIYKFDQADRILSLDDDFLSGFNVRYIKDYSKKHAYSEENKAMNRLYMVETTLSITGAKADHRLAVKPSEMIGIARAIASALGVSGASNSGLSEKAAKWIAPMAKDLLANKGKSIVIAGDNQPPMVHALAHSINAALGNVGATVTYTEPFQQFADVLQVDQLRQLVQEIDGGAVKMLVMLGGNPVYNTPADLKINEDRLNKIPLRVHLSQHFDETSELCHWHVSEKHFLESWSDARAYDGTVSMIQPLIIPLYDSHNAHEVAQLFLKENFDKKDLDILKMFWQMKGSGLSDGDFEKNWRRAVHDGFVANSAAGVNSGNSTAIAAKNVSVNPAFMNQPTAPMPNNGALEISILPDPCVYDGRFSNNGWLQELPNPITKITWDNVALVSPNTAMRLNLNQSGSKYDPQMGGIEGTSFINTKGGNSFSDLVTLQYQGAEIGQGVPVWIQPGQPDDVVTIYLGYGRAKAGRVGTGLGYNAYDVR